MWAEIVEAIGTRPRLKVGGSGSLVLANAALRVWEYLVIVSYSGGDYKCDRQASIVCRMDI